MNYSLPDTRYLSGGGGETNSAVVTGDVSFDYGGIVSAALLILVITILV